MRAKRPYPTDPWQEHPGLCNSRKTDGSGLCRRGAGQNTPHPGIGACSKHGGCTPGAVVGAERIREAQILGPILEHYRDRIGEHPDPYEGMLEVVRFGWAWMRMLEARVAELNDDTGELFVEDHQGDARPHVLVGMLGEARREHRRNCEAAIRAGIAERMVSLAEDQAEAMATFIRGVLTELGHELEDPAVAGVVKRHLFALPSSKDDPDDDDGLAGALVPA